MNLSATRISNSFGVVLPPSSTSGVLIRIYPAAGIGEPVEIKSETFSIGRDLESSLSIEDDSVSRRHAVIQWDGQVHSLLDLSSTNGSFVNETRIGQHTLMSGDRVRFGKQIFKYLKAGEIEAQYHEVVFKLMTTDGLTQVYNKRYFLETLDRELLLSSRSQSRPCVLLMDLDHFKSVNDTYGHLAGDAVLAEFCRRAASRLRSGQLLARFGGEEFAVLCTHGNLAAAVETAESIRQETCADPVSFEGRVIPVSVSIGVAIATNDSTVSSDELIENADRLLYLAKTSGRNQVRAAGNVPSLGREVNRLPQPQIQFTNSVQG
jgi:diguanylate cyclase (GGDEF)-like protein